MRVVAADSGSSVLDASFEPTCIVCTVAVLVEPPYRCPSATLAEAHFWPIEDSYGVLLRELELARRLLEEHGADVIHFDASLRRARLDEINVADVARYWPRVPENARARLTRVFHQLKFMASELTARTGVPVIAIGKDSVPVRIAELCCGAFGLLAAARKAVEEDRELLLGLPVRCVVSVRGDRVIARSLVPAEHDLMGVAVDEEGILGSVELLDMPNPTLRGFRVVIVRPRGRG